MAAKRYYYQWYVFPDEEGKLFNTNGAWCVFDRRNIAPQGDCLPIATCLNLSVAQKLNILLNQSD